MTRSPAPINEDDDVTAVRHPLVNHIAIGLRDDLFGMRTGVNVEDYWVMFTLREIARPDNRRIHGARAIRARQLDLGQRRRTLRHRRERAEAATIGSPQHFPASTPIQEIEAMQELLLSLAKDGVVSPAFPSQSLRLAFGVERKTKEMTFARTRPAGDDDRSIAFVEIDEL